MKAIDPLACYRRQIEPLRNINDLHENFANTILTHANYLHSHTDRYLNENNLPYQNIHSVKSKAVMPNDKICIKSINFPLLSKRESPALISTTDGNQNNYDAPINTEYINDGYSSKHFNIFVKPSKDTKMKKLGSSHPVKPNILKLFEDIEAKDKNEYVVKMAPKNYVLANEELQNSCFVLIKDKSLHRYLLRRKKPIIKSYNYEEINLQAKGIQLIQKEKAAKSVQKRKALKMPKKADDSIKDSLLRRSLSMIGDKPNIYDTNYETNSADKIQRNAIKHCITAPDKNDILCEKKQRQNLIRILKRVTLQRRNSTDSIKEKIKSENISSLKNPEDKKRRAKYKKKKKEEKKEEPFIQQKKPPVPRFEFLVRPPPKEKIEDIRIIEEKPKMRPKPAIFLPASNYLFSIAYGNNSCIVRRIMERRTYWKETPTFNSAFQFKWHPISRLIKFEQLDCTIKQIVNHLEFHYEITTKDNLFTNLSNYCELNKLNVFNYVPLTFIVELDSPSYYTEFEKVCNTYNIIQAGCASIKEYGSEEQIEYARTIINNKLSNFTYNKEKRIVKTCIPLIKHTHFKGKNIWIIKPTGFNRGRGVEVFTTLDQMKKIIKEASEGINENEKEKERQETKQTHKAGGKLNESTTLNTPVEYEKLPESIAWQSSHPPISNLNNLPSIVKTRSFVIQKYIERPLLINKRKFDIRAWVLVTHELKGYFFKEGYLRMSSFEYIDDANNRAVHLTNNAVQKNTDAYGQIEDGNQLSYGDFQKYIDATYPEKSVSVKDYLYLKMKEYVNITLLSVKKKLNPDNKKFCFEIFGYDFMVDEEFNVWLIEVNTNPCLEESSQLLKCLLPRMLDDAFKLTVDIIFPKKKKKDDTTVETMKPLPVQGYSDEESMWEFVVQIGNVKSESSCKNVKQMEDLVDKMQDNI